MRGRTKYVITRQNGELVMMPDFALESLCAEGPSWQKAIATGPFDSPVEALLWLVLQDEGRPLQSVPRTTP